MPEFIPIENNKEKQTEEGNKPSEVQKATDAKEVQKQETERIKLQKEAEFAQKEIKSSEDLQARLVAVAERENKLAKEFMDFDNRKATELSELQKLKAEHERRIAELVKREQDLAIRIRNVELREKLVQEREDLMNSVELQKLEETEKYNSLVERLKRTFPRISALMGDNANILDRVGFHNFADDLWYEIEKMLLWSKNDDGKHSDVIVSWLKGEVEDCNKKAVEMIGNPKVYAQRDWDMIVDNLEECWTLLPELKPPQLPSDVR